MIYAKLGAALALLAAFAWGAIADYHAGKKAGQDAVQAAWDKDKSAIQAVTDAAIAEATKQRDAAYKANEDIENDYQTKLVATTANAVLFANRLRDAEARLTANSCPTIQAGNNPDPATAGQASSAGQLGTLAGLTADLHAECTANADQLDALIAEIKPQM